MKSALILAALLAAASVYAAASTISADGWATRRYVQCLGHHPSAPDRPSARPAECM